MGILYDLIRCKRRLYELLWSDARIREFLAQGNQAPDMTAEQFQTFVKPYAKAPEAMGDRGAYIFYDIVPLPINRSAIQTLELTIWVLASEETLLTGEGTSVDLAANAIDELLSREMVWGIGSPDWQGGDVLTTAAGLCCRKLIYRFRGYRHG